MMDQQCERLASVLPTNLEAITEVFNDLELYGALISHWRHCPNSERIIIDIENSLEVGDANWRYYILINVIRSNYADLLLSLIGSIIVMTDRMSTAKKKARLISVSSIGISYEDDRRYGTELSRSDCSSRKDISRPTGLDVRPKMTKEKPDCRTRRSHAFDVGRRAQISYTLGGRLEPFFTLVDADDTLTMFTTYCELVNNDLQYDTCTKCQLVLILCLYDIFDDCMSDAIPDSVRNIIRCVISVSNLEKFVEKLSLNVRSKIKNGPSKSEIVDKSDTTVDCSIGNISSSFPGTHQVRKDMKFTDYFVFDACSICSSKSFYHNYHEMTVGSLYTLLLERAGNLSLSMDFTFTDRKRKRNDRLMRASRLEKQIVNINTRILCSVRDYAAINRDILAPIFKSFIKFQKRRMNHCIAVSSHDAAEEFAYKFLSNKGMMELCGMLEYQLAYMMSVFSSTINHPDCCITLFVLSGYNVQVWTSIMGQYKYHLPLKHYEVIILSLIRYIKETGIIGNNDSGILPISPDNSIISPVSILASNESTIEVLLRRLNDKSGVLFESFNLMRVYQSLRCKSNQNMVNQYLISSKNKANFRSILSLLGHEILYVLSRDNMELSLTELICSATQIIAYPVSMDRRYENNIQTLLNYVSSKLFPSSGQENTPIGWSLIISEVLFSCCDDFIESIIFDMPLELSFRMLSALVDDVISLNSRLDDIEILASEFHDLYVNRLIKFVMSAFVSLLEVHEIEIRELLGFCESYWISIGYENSEGFELPSSGFIGSNVEQDDRIVKDSVLSYDTLSSFGGFCKSMSTMITNDITVFDPDELTYVGSIIIFFLSGASNGSQDSNYEFQRFPLNVLDPIKYACKLSNTYSDAFGLCLKIIQHDMMIRTKSYTKLGSFNLGYLKTVKYFRKANKRHTISINDTSGDYSHHAIGRIKDNMIRIEVVPDMKYEAKEKNIRPRKQNQKKTTNQKNSQQHISKKKQTERQNNLIHNVSSHTNTNTNIKSNKTNNSLDAECNNLNESWIDYGNYSGSVNSIISGISNGINGITFGIGTGIGNDTIRSKLKGKCSGRLGPRILFERIIKTIYSTIVFRLSRMKYIEFDETKVSSLPPAMRLNHVNIRLRSLFETMTNLSLLLDQIKILLPEEFNSLASYLDEVNLKNKYLTLSNPPVNNQNTNVRHRSQIGRGYDPEKLYIMSKKMSVTDLELFLSDALYNAVCKLTSSLSLRKQVVRRRLDKNLNNIGMLTMYALYNMYISNDMEDEFNIVLSDMRISYRVKLKRDMQRYNSKGSKKTGRESDWVSYMIGPLCMELLELYHYYDYNIDTMIHILRRSFTLLPDNTHINETSNEDSIENDNMSSTKLVGRTYRRNTEIAMEIEKALDSQLRLLVGSSIDENITMTSYWIMNDCPSQFIRVQWNMVIRNMFNEYLYKYHLIRRELEIDYGDTRCCGISTICSKRRQRRRVRTCSRATPVGEGCSESIPGKETCSCSLLRVAAVEGLGSSSENSSFISRDETEESCLYKVSLLELMLRSSNTCSETYDFFAGLILISERAVCQPVSVRLEWLREEVSNLVELFKDEIILDILGSGNRIVGVSISDIRLMKSAAKAPFMIRFRCDDGKKRSYLIKSGDNLNNERLVYDTVSFVNKLLSWNSVPMSMLTYKSIHFNIMFEEEESNRSVRAKYVIGGLIEIVDQTVSRHEIGLMKFVSTNDYLKHLGNGNTAEIMKLQWNYVRTLAAASLISFVLQIKDRHNANLLIRDDGQFTHIDFGYILDSSPGNDLNFERAPFKLTNEMLEVIHGKLIGKLGEDENLAQNMDVGSNDEHRSRSSYEYENTEDIVIDTRGRLGLKRLLGRYNRFDGHGNTYMNNFSLNASAGEIMFKMLISDGYSILRERSDVFNQIVGKYAGLCNKSFKHETLKNLQTRLQSGSSDNEAFQYISNQVNNSVNAFTTRIYDYVQHVLNGIHF